jgi:catechol 2,3-dioxygenase-like lactoylglutathione lyase family enzyme
MEPRLSFVSLGVADLPRAARFYRDGLGLVLLKETPDIVLFELGRTWLALVPRSVLAAESGVASEGSGFAGIALAHNVRRRDEVEPLLARAASAGGRIVRPAGEASWGGYAGVFADPDGFLWEVAWNPRFPHV